MGASMVKSCFVGEPSAELAAHREARRLYERGHLTPAASAASLRGMSSRRPGSERNLADVKKPGGAVDRELELPRTAVRLQQLRDATPPLPIMRRKETGPQASLASDAGTVSMSDSSFDDAACSSALFPSPPATRSPAGFRSLLPQAYALECVVGRGTTSTCYRCVRRSDGRRFACKIIEKRRLASSARRRAEIAVQLRREVEVLRHLDHPHVAKLEDAFENDAFLILIMELLEGGELFDAIVEKGRFSEKEAVHVARSVLSALQHMHAQGIVHRDLKPENMLLSVSRKRRSPSESGGNGCADLNVKLIDFGFARVLEPGTTATSFLGTGGYLAPEILLHQPYGVQVDMWSFGVLVYLLLCGRLPFPVTTKLRATQKVTSLFKLSFPRKYWQGVSPLAIDFLQRVLMLNPATRLSAAQALAHPWLQL